MFYIITYDVNEMRVNRVKKLLRVFLKWDQNSVVSGDLTDSQYLELRKELDKILDKSKDHVIIFKSRSSKFLEREDIGTPRGLGEDDALFI
jgi:CRISPR-associated protein Cas2